MLGNWSVILNVLLLAGVIAAIARMMQKKRANLGSNYIKPSVAPSQADTLDDDIISVRKINREEVAPMPSISPALDEAAYEKASTPKATIRESRPVSVMMLLLAKEDRQLAGYELLQTLLSVGLRFGEGHLFHRHQFSNGQGPVLCSVAAATASGMFDLQQIGAFSVRGLCVFMEASGSPAIDEERFSIMLDTARQLSEDLDTLLLDEQRQPLTQASIRRYYRTLSLPLVNEMELA